MTKELLTHLSHQFCINCCGYNEESLCDSRNTTCDKLAGFLIGCKYYKPVNEEKLEELAEESCRDNNFYHGSREYLSTEAYIIGYKEGYRKAKRNKI